MGARERLAQLIQESGMTQSEIARRLSPNGENPQWINNRLRGISQIKADDLPRIAAALRISPCRFFEDVHTHQAATPSYADAFTRALAPGVAGDDYRRPGAPDHTPRCPQAPPRPARARRRKLRVAHLSRPEDDFAGGDAGLSAAK